MEQLVFISNKKNEITLLTDYTRRSFKVHSYTYLTKMYSKKHRDERIGSFYVLGHYNHNAPVPILYRQNRSSCNTKKAWPRAKGSPIIRKWVKRGKVPVLLVNVTERPISSASVVASGLSMSKKRLALPVVRFPTLEWENIVLRSKFTFPIKQSAVEVVGLIKRLFNLLFFLMLIFSGYPNARKRRYNWSEKAKRRNTTGTGR